MLYKCFFLTEIETYARPQVGRHNIDIYSIVVIYQLMNH